MRADELKTVEDVIAYLQERDGVYIPEPRLGPQPETDEEAIERGEALASVVQAAEEALAKAATPAQRDHKGQVLCTTSGKPITDETRDINPSTGMQKDYVVLCPDERAKGFVRPYRETYTHLTCGSTTTMGRALSETYARDPKFYSGTFCCHCRAHFPLGEFKWLDGEAVGS